MMAQYSQLSWSQYKLITYRFKCSAAKITELTECESLGLTGIQLTPVMALLAARFELGTTVWELP